MNNSTAPLFTIMPRHPDYFDHHKSQKRRIVAQNPPLTLSIHSPLITLLVNTLQANQ